MERETIFSNEYFSLVKFPHLFKDMVVRYRIESNGLAEDYEIGIDYDAYEREDGSKFIAGNNRGIVTKGFSSSIGSEITTYINVLNIANNFYNQVREYFLTNDFEEIL